MTKASPSTTTPQAPPVGITALAASLAELLLEASKAWPVPNRYSNAAQAAVRRLKLEAMLPPCIRCGQPACFANGSDTEPDLCTRCFPAWLEEQ